MVDLAKGTHSWTANCKAERNYILFIRLIEELILNEKAAFFTFL